MLREKINEGRGRRRRSAGGENSAVSEGLLKKVTHDPNQAGK